ncbi:MAG TPA: MFS transporter [Dehalococcoidales bacterium]|nr:MFS transporter [Dehalococcoidales bacterium]
MKSPQSLPQPGQGTSKGMALLIASLSSFLTPFTGSSINIALPSIGQQFKLDAVALSWVATIYLLAAAMFLVPFGRLADIRGRKMIYRIGIVIDLAGSLLCALSPSGTWLMVFRAVQGLGGAMIFGTGVAILTSVFPPQERGKALGWNVGATYLGLSIGPLAGGFFTQYFGWQGIFYFNAFLGLVITVLAWWKLKGEWAEAKGEKFDWQGALIYSAGLVLIMYAFSVFPALWGTWLVVAGIIGLGIFVWWEMRQEYPVLHINLFRHNTVFAMSNLAALINYSATYAVSYLLSLYLQYVKGFQPEHAGLVLIAQPVMMAIFSPLAGSLSDRIEPRVMASLGMFLTTVGLAMLIFVRGDTGLLYLIICLVVLGIGFGLFSSPNTNAVMGSVERRQYGVASGMLGTMRLTGQAFSLGTTLLLFAIYIGRVQITADNYPLFLKSMQTAFIIMTVLCFLGIFASIARGRAHGKS